MADWKQAHANEAESYVYDDRVEATLVPILDRVVREFADNMGFEYKGFPRYGLHKIITYTAQIVLARSKGFDPELLRTSEAEATAHQLNLMRMFAEAGKPVFLVVTDDEPAPTPEEKP